MTSDDTTNPIDRAWGARDIPDQRGRTILITGPSSGLGLVATGQLAARGATVIMAVRDPAKGERVRAALLAADPRAAVEVRELDLLDLDSVRRLADRLRAERRTIDVLVNNAGIGAQPHRLSPQGYESQFATNHLGHFALTGLLLDLLARGTEPRVVTVTSSMYRLGRLNLDDPAVTRRYSSGRAYASSKLANALFGVELDRRLRAADSPVRSLLAHPGMARTPMQANANTLAERLVVTVLGRSVGRSVEEGALPILFAATAPGLAGGTLVGPQKLFGPMRAGAVRLGRPADDTELAGRLWTASEELTGARFALTR